MRRRDEGRAGRRVAARRRWPFPGLSWAVGRTEISCKLAIFRLAPAQKKELRARKDVCQGMNHHTPFSKLDTHLPLPDMSGHNPFQKADPTDVPADAPEGSYTYSLVQSAPSVPDKDCETAAEAVEIAFRWGTTTLHVAHLTPPRSFHVGEASGREAVDYQLPANGPGMARWPVVRKPGDGPARVVIPAGATGTATFGGRTVKLSELRADGRAALSADLAGALELPLQASTRVRFELGGVEIEVASVKAGARVSGRFSLDRRGLPFQALSMALHLGLLGAAAAFMPPNALASEDELSHDRIDGLKVILAASAERELDAPKDTAKDSANGTRDASRSEPATSASDRRGSATGPGKSGHRGGPGGPDRDNPNREVSRSEALATARDFGMIALLHGLDPRPAGPSAWADVGTMPGSPREGVAWDGSLESGGSGDLGLTGIGDSGGPGTGIELGRIGTSPGGLDRFGTRPGRDRGHRAQGPVVHATPPTTSGRIPQEIIQRVVRSSFGRFRACYESGLRTNPSLAGRVSVRFVIGRDGGVMSAANGGSDLPDPAVVACVVGSFLGLSFPQTDEGGTATVVYPIAFAPAQ